MFLQARPFLLSSSTIQLVVPIGTTCAVLVSGANDKEYAFVRADNWGDGSGYKACTHACSWEDWGAWLAAMDGAKVQLSVTNVGNGTANIKATMIGNNGVTYTQTHNGINNIDANIAAFKLTMEKAHLVFDLPFANSSFASFTQALRTCTSQIRDFEIV